MNTARQEIAKKKIARFVQRFDESYRWLACYAALPLILTPELLNYLRNHFLRGQVPWVAEADLLLSDLCRPVGYEQYALEPEVRAFLIGEMHEALGEARMQEVARLLIRYVHQLQHLKHPVDPYELQAERWSAMAFIADRRGEAVREIAESFRDQLVGDVPDTSGEMTWISETELARLVRITEELAPRIEEYPKLLDYARAVSRLLADPDGLAAMREQGRAGTVPTKRVGDVDLPDVGPLVEGTIEITEQGDKVYFEGKAAVPPEIQSLLDELDDASTSHRRRAEIGDRLAEIGDPRPGVGLREDGLPDIVWLRVEKGEVTLENIEETFAVVPFYIAQYPLTYSQYRSFLEAKDGYLAALAAIRARSALRDFFGVWAVFCHNRFAGLGRWGSLRRAAGWCAAVPGTTTRSTRAPPTATTIIQAIGTTTWGCGWRVCPTSLPPFDGAGW